jgi:hypothetical protein
MANPIARHQFNRGRRLVNKRQAAAVVRADYRDSSTPPVALLFAQPRPANGMALASKNGAWGHTVLREETAMFEVILTYRRDFSEQIGGRYRTYEEARNTAEMLLSRCAILVARAWVRHVRVAQPSR